MGYGIYLLVLRWWAARLIDDEEEHGSADAGDALDVAVDAADLALHCPQWRHPLARKCPRA